MRKISLLTLLFASSASYIAAAETVVPGCPQAFQGLYIAGNIGYAVGGGKQKEVDFRTVDTINKFHNHLRIEGVDGGFGVGYMHRFCNWTIGLAFDTNWANTKGKIKRSTISRETGLLESVKLKAREKNSLQFYARTGYVIEGKIMPFVGLGWDNAAWRYRVTEKIVDETFTGKKHKRLNGLMWKAGVEFLVIKNFVLGFEYTGSKFSPIKVHKNINTDFEEVNVMSKFRPLVNKFALTAKYFF